MDTSTVTTPFERVERPLRPLTRRDYAVLARSGAFRDQRVELLNGQVFQMSPQNGPHANMVQLLNRILMPRLVGRADVRVQLPLALSSSSEPEPDFALCNLTGPNRRNGRMDHPSHAYLVIEVAETTLRTDLGLKRVLYALGGVAEYWVVDLKGWQILVFRNSEQGEWQETLTFVPGQTLSPLAFPDVEIAVSDVLAP